MAIDSTPQPTDEDANSSGARRWLLIAGAAVLTIAVVVAFASSRSTPAPTSYSRGYFDLATLAASVKDSVKNWHSAQGATLLDVRCLRTDECWLVYRDCTITSLLITVSPYGDNWESASLDQWGYTRTVDGKCNGPVEYFGTLASGDVVKVSK